MAVKAVDAAEACAASTLTNRPPEVWGSWNRSMRTRIHLGREANIGTEVGGVGPSAAGDVALDQRRHAVEQRHGGGVDLEGDTAGGGDLAGVADQPETR